MSFKDIYAPCELPNYPLARTPMLNVQLVRSIGGFTQTNRVSAHFLRRFTIPNAVRRFEHFAAVEEHWYAVGGPENTWPFRDPLDFASVRLAGPNVEPTVTALDVELEAIEDSTTEFQLSKLYTVEGETYRRPIHFPVLSSVKVAVDGVVVTTGFSVSRPGGVITFDESQATGDSPSILKTVTAGFLFDCKVRYEDGQSLEGIFRTWNVAGYSALVLDEEPYCVDEGE